MSNQYFHYSHKSVVKGGSGGTAALSYIAGTDRYANKIDEVVSPPNVVGADLTADALIAGAEAGAKPKRKPAKSAKDQNPETKRTIARRVVFQLPPNIKPEEAQGILETVQKSLYADNQCPSIGVVHQKWSKTRNQMEYHAHVLVMAYQTTSEHQKSYDPKSKQCERYTGYDKTQRRDTLRRERLMFQNIYNDFLTEKGIEGRVDCRSHAARILSGEHLPAPRERVPLSIWHSPDREAFMAEQKRHPSKRIKRTQTVIDRIKFRAAQISSFLKNRSQPKPLAPKALQSLKTGPKRQTGRNRGYER